MQGRRLFISLTSLPWASVDFGLACGYATTRQCHASEPADDRETTGQ